MKPVTARRRDIRSVAERAGVSIATVSRVMNGVSSVDAKLVRRVQKAAAELDYTPNTQARALVSGRSRMMGLIVSQITNPFFPELIQSFEHSALERNYDILIGSTDYSPERMELCVRRMVERNVEGVAVMTFGMDDELLEALTRHGIPVVSIGRSSAMPRHASLEVDFQKGISEAVQHLAVLGHRNIAFLSGPLNIETARARLEAFHEAMKAIGAPARLIVEGDHTMEGGLAGAEHLLQHKSPPTAIVCSNDMTAIGVLHAVSARGLSVPEDISIVGFDDIHMARFTVPPLTTVRMSPKDLAGAALDILQNSIASDKKPSTAPRIPTQLFVRQTTGYPRTAASVRKGRSS